MKVFSSAVALAAGVAALAAAASVRADPIAANAPAYQGKGDWRRHEIVRIWRDAGGCRLSVISYHHPDGAIDTREDRDCAKD